MFESHILCLACKKKYPLEKMIFMCEDCAGPLEIIFDYKKIKKAIDINKLKGRPFNHARYLEFYPVRNLVSLQEGGTPLIRSKNLEKYLNLNCELYFKYEATNPTGSFKDRGSSVEIAKAIEFKQKRVSCASTGNMGASLAAYSAVTNLNCSIFTPRDAKPVKIKQILAYGARVYHVDGDYAQTIRMVEYAFKKHGIYLLGDYLYRREGTKSLGFELAEQISPDYVFCPVGNGTLLSATWKAFNEFKTLNLIRKKPKMIGIQAEKCNPIVKAFKNNTKIKLIKNPRTLAVAIECGDPLDGEKALSSIKESGGFADHVSDREILRARELLAEREGLFAEPAGAASLAGLIKNKNKIRGNVVCLVTGHGLKSPRTDVKGEARDIKSNIKVLDKIFR